MCSRLMGLMLRLAIETALTGKIILRKRVAPSTLGSGR